MSGEYSFADDRAWLNNSLQLRHQELVAIYPIKHGPERTAQIERELTHLVFELYQRETPTLVPKDARFAGPGKWHFPPRAA